MITVKEVEVLKKLIEISEYIVQIYKENKKYDEYYNFHYNAIIILKKIINNYHNN